jgi:hypothetical protein
LPHYDIAMSNLRAGMILGGGVALGGAVYLSSLTAIWMALGRPDGPEQKILDQIRARMPAWVPLFGKKATA